MSTKLCPKSWDDVANDRATGEAPNRVAVEPGTGNRGRLGWSDPDNYPPEPSLRNLRTVNLDSRSPLADPDSAHEEPQMTARREPRVVIEGPDWCRLELRAS